jgi:toxin-antitoxin system PIN domain toxin
MGYVRIVTHPGILRTPLTPDEALANVAAILRFPRIVVITEGDDFLRAYHEVTAGQIVRGRLVPDAHLATILFQHGVRTLYTNDSDYRRFSFLRVVNPFVAAASPPKMSHPAE